MAPKNERRTLSMHPRLLMDVIQKQAGTLQKAVLEGVMNSVDAGATEIRVTADAQAVTISDDGQGFRSKDEIESWFETFGQPHDESEGKTYGRFRMGRGQMFAFGVNEWRTGTFRMRLDIETDGLDYTLHEGLTPHRGCEIRISLYDHLLPSALSALAREIKRYVRYVGIPVLLNGVRISVDPSQEKWDAETDDAYFRFKKTGDAEVYNLGVFVRGYANHIFATGAVVVSKVRLDLNFARNDIDEKSCAAWRRIRKTLDQNAQRETEREKKLTDAERQYLAEMVKNGSYRGTKSPRDLPILTDVMGKQWTARRLTNRLAQMDIQEIAACDLHDMQGELIHNRCRAFVFAQETLDRFDAPDPEAFLRILSDCRLVMTHDLHVGDLDAMRAEISSDFRTIDPKEYTPTEKALIHILRMNQRHIMAYDPEGWSEGRMNPRTFRIGESELARAWTDGRTQIVIDRAFLRAGDPGTVAYWIEKGQTILHEFCHDGNSAGTHDHSLDFYRLFENSLKAGVLATFVEKMLVAWPKALATRSRELTRRGLRTQDRVEELRRKQDAFNALAGAQDAGPASKSEAPARPVTKKVRQGTKGRDGSGSFSTQNGRVRGSTANPAQTTLF